MPFSELKTHTERIAFIIRHKLAQSKLPATFRAKAIVDRDS